MRQRKPMPSQMNRGTQANEMPSFFLFSVPSTSFALLSRAPSVELVATQIRGHIAGSFPPTKYGMRLAFVSR